MWPQEIDVQEELQDPEFLRLLARAKGQEAASTDRLAEAQEEEAAGKVKKRKRERPVRLKDIHPQGVCCSLDHSQAHALMSSQIQIFSLRRMKRLQS